MTDTKTRKRSVDKLTRRHDALLKAEDLSLRARLDPTSVAKEAAAFAAERRYAWETRGRTGYVSTEAQRPFEAEARLIRRSDDPGMIETDVDAAPQAKLTFGEMRQRRDTFPGVAREVRGHKQRKHEQRHRKK